jgi:hypothetical protein
VRLGEPDQPPPHRLVRLLLTAGGAAAGMCLVVGLVTLMVALGAPHHQAPRAAGQFGGHSGESRANGGGAGRKVGRTVAAVSGHGGRLGREIPVHEQTVWGLAWSFHCPPGRSGEFTVRDSDHAAGNRVDFTASGAHRAGLWWVRARTFRVLHIVSGCPWHARVVLPAEAPHPSASPRPEHSRGWAQNRGRGHGRKQGNANGHGQKRGHTPKRKHSPNRKHSPKPKHSPKR